MITTVTNLHLSSVSLRMNDPIQFKKIRGFIFKNTKYQSQCGPNGLVIDSVPKVELICQRSGEAFLLPSWK